MNLLKDLLFTGGNKSLDIARFSSLGSLSAYWTGVFIGRIPGDGLVIGGGCAAIFGGAAAWIHFRQKHEAEKAQEAK